MSASSSGVHGDEAQARPGRSLNARHYSGRCSGDGTVVLVDVAAEQVATVNIARRLISLLAWAVAGTARPGAERPRLCARAGSSSRTMRRTTTPCERSTAVTTSNTLRSQRGLPAQARKQDERIGMILALLLATSRWLVRPAMGTGEETGIPLPVLAFAQARAHESRSAARLLWTRSGSGEDVGAHASASAAWRG